jgi:4-hydroxy-3-methylbut-2-enyl diphosphate reductase
MIILRADILGVCMGVEKALNRVLKLREENPDLPIATIGPLIHNNRVLSYLAEKGINVVSRPGDFPRGLAVIRAHGLPPEERRRYETEGVTVVDATCPRVIASQKRVAESSSLGRFVVLVGDPAHGEIQGLAGFVEEAGPGYAVVASPEEAESLDLPGDTLVIAQTTIKQEEYDAVVEVLRRKGVGLEVARSICPATRDRQTALRELADKVDALLIIGGKNSANTTALYTTAASTGKPAWHIEGAADIPPEVRKYHRVGLSAGASTPDWIIAEVEAALGGND